MDLTHKLLVLLAALLFLVGAFFAYNWLRAHEEYTRADAQAKADQSAIAQLAKQQSNLAEQLKQTQSEQHSQLAAVQKQYAQTQSPEQLAALIGKVMSLPQPIRVVTPEATLDNPHPQKMAEVPLPDAPQVKAFVQSCQECQLRLRTSEKQIELAAQESDSFKQELSLTQKDRDTWKRAAQGGSWTRRAAKRATAFAIDAGITFVLTCASHHCK